MSQSAATALFLAGSVRVDSATIVCSNNTFTFNPFTGVASQWPWHLNADGTWTLRRPAASDVSGLAASATTDTTIASNITSGTLAAGRLPAFTGGACTTTAGSVVISCAPLLAAANTWTGIQRYGLNPMPNAGD